MAAFIFYDTEASGLDKNFGQVFQFAAVLTDNELNVIDKFEIRSRRMPRIVPEPSALLWEGINPETLDQAEYSYYEFATKINYPINAKGKTSNKLEYVAPANGLTGHDAHDAMGDVTATIFVAILVKELAPALWGRVKAWSSRGTFNSLIKDDEPVIIFDFNIGWPVIFPALKVGKVDDGRNTLFLIWDMILNLLTLMTRKPACLGGFTPFAIEKMSRCR